MSAYAFRLVIAWAILWSLLAIEARWHSWHLLVGAAGGFLVVAFDVVFNGDKP